MEELVLEKDKGEQEKREFSPRYTELIGIITKDAEGRHFQALQELKFNLTDEVKAGRITPLEANLLGTIVDNRLIEMDRKGI